MDLKFSVSCSSVWLINAPPVSESEKQFFRVAVGIDSGWKKLLMRLQVAHEGGGEQVRNKPESCPRQFFELPRTITGVSNTLERFRQPLKAKAVV